MRQCLGSADQLVRSQTPMARHIEELLLVLDPLLGMGPLRLVVNHVMEPDFVMAAQVSPVFAQAWVRVQVAHGLAQAGVLHHHHHVCHVGAYPPTQETNYRRRRDTPRELQANRLVSSP